MGEKTHVDDDAGPYRSTRKHMPALIVAALFLFLLLGNGLPGERDAGAAVNGAGAAPPVFTDYLPLPILIAIAVLLVFSAFFSGSETAFFSIHRLRLRAIAEEKTLTARLVTNMMRSPGRLLTTILVGNMMVNVLIAVFLGTRVQHYFEQVFGWRTALAYPAAVAVGTTILVFFGEISPKIVAMRTSELFARVAALPLSIADRLLAPVRNSLLRLTDLLFRITRFHELRAAPFITDEELRVALTTGETRGAIEKGERQMIQGILDFTDTKLREVLTPR
ncbi:MAG: CNNM domain-containing protein, partial [Candidatus Hydrogenedentes bacterium]|nr:CNNM domain-containing protein [Candidatus Hydrogenedentota bacterium]